MLIVPFYLFTHRLSRSSCTGGLACQRLTNLPGASDVVIGAFTPYQYKAKDSMLGLQLENSREAVSQQTTLDLAKRAKEKTGADIAAAVTGYLGPTGGDEKDPIGTIYLCVIGKETVEKKIHQPWPIRTQAQWGASTHLLNLVLKELSL